VSDKQLEKIMLMQPQIIYEDDNVLVLAKPAGMLVHPTVKLEPDTLYGFVKKYYADAHLDLGVHPVFRLDRFTSGLVLFAKQAGRCRRVYPARP
jgi:23S rRNA pseudouridine1911/1915/1917 synthase